MPQSELTQEIRFHKLDNPSYYDDKQPHRHGYFEIFFFNKANGSHIIDFEEYKLSGNSIHVVRPGQVHQLQLEEESNGSFITFSKQALHDMNNAPILSLNFLKHHNGANVLSLSEPEFKKLYEHVLELKSNIGYAALRNAWIVLILNEMDKYLTQKDHAYQKTSSDKTVAQFNELVDQHFHHHREVGFYIDKLSITEHSLNAKLKEITGHTASQAILERILLEAKRLILHSESSFKEICYDLGFTDAAHFSKFVKQFTGKTPSELRSE